MANTSISNLAAGAAVSATDIIPNVQTAGVGPVKTTAAQIKTFISDSPTLVTPALGTPTSGTLTSCTGLPVSTGIAGFGTGVATALGNNANAANGVVALDANSDASIGGVISMGSSFARNRVINGQMAIDQRNAGATQTITAAAAAAYTVDRFLGACTGANVTGQRVAGPTGFQYCYQFTGAASVTGITFSQRIESIYVADLASKNVTISANISNSVLTTVTWTAYYANSEDNFTATTQIATGTFTVSGTATTYSATFNAGANAAKGIEIIFSVGAQTSGTWKITGVQLEPGTKATPYERRPYTSEFLLASRYYQLIAAGNNAGISFGGYLAATRVDTIIKCLVPMRAAPTLVSTTGTDYYTFYVNNANDRFDSFTMDAGVTNQNNIYLYNLTGVSGTAGQFGTLNTSNAAAYLAVSAEL